MKTKNIFIRIIALFFPLLLQGQLINRGTLIVKSGASATINTGLKNQSGIVQNAGTITINGSMISDSGSAISGNGAYFIDKNWENAGTFLAGTSTVFFRGSTNAIVANNGQAFYRIRLEKTGSGTEVALTQPAQISNLLSFVGAQNRLLLGDNDFTLGTAATIAGAATGKCIITNGTGLLKKVNHTGSFVFPIAVDNSTYNALTVKQDGTADIIGVRVLASALQNGGSGSALTADAVAASWQVTEAIEGGSNLTLTTRWSPTDQLPNFDKTQCAVSFHNGTTWDITTSMLGAASGATAVTRARANVASGGYFAVLDATLAGCGAPGATMPIAQSATSVAVHWAAVSGVSQYRLRYRVSGATAWNPVITIAANYHVFSGLTPETTYQYQIQSYCPGGYSAYFSTRTFATSAGVACATNTDVSATATSSTQAFLAWKYVENAIHYQFRTRPLGTATWSAYTTVAQPNQLFTSLSPATTYQYQLRTKCADGTYTDLFNGQFTTLTGGFALVSQFAATETSTTNQAVRIFPNPAYDQLNISFDNIVPARIAILSANGTHMSNTNTINLGDKIDIAAFPTGMYLVHVTDQCGQQYTQTFTKM